MLANGEEVGTAPIRKSTSRSIRWKAAAVRAWHAERAGRDRAGRARLDVRPRAVRLHAEDGRQRRDRRPARSTARWGRRSSWWPSGARWTVGDVMVVVLDRSASRRSIQAIRDAGGRVRLITDGDVAGALLAGVTADAGGAAVGHRRHARGCHLGGRYQVHGRRDDRRLWPRDDDERKAAEDAGYDVDRILTHDDLVKGEDAFFSATGVTDGDVLQGVRYGARRPTESLVMRTRSGAVRRIMSVRPPEAAHADRLLYLHVVREVLAREGRAVGDEVGGVPSKTIRPPSWPAPGSSRWSVASPSRPGGARSRHRLAGLDQPVSCPARGPAGRG